MSAVAYETTSDPLRGHASAAVQDRVGVLAPIGLQKLIGRVGRRLSRPPRVALIGEFNTGKSTLTNTLLGSATLPTSVTENTRLPVLVHYAARPSLSVEFADRRHVPVSWTEVAGIAFTEARMLHLGLPIERLKTFELIDTPGLGTGLGEIDSLALDACQRAHVAVWCTAATQAWRASELSVWQRMPARLKRSSVLAITYKDALASERDASKLRARLRSEAAPQFRSLVLISATQAAEARRQGAGVVEDRQWQTSGGAGFSAAVSSSVSTVLAQRLNSAERLLNQMTSDVGTEPSSPQPH